MILITGERGVGKTRFINEISLRAKDLGYTVLLHHSRGWDRYHPFSTIVAFLRVMLEKAPDWVPSTRDSLANAVEAFTGFSPNKNELELLFWLLGGSDVSESVTKLDGHSRKGMVTRLFGLLLSLYARSNSPLLLALDDIHQSDSFSVEYLLTVPLDKGVVFVVTLPPLGSTHIHTEQGTEKITLKPFNEKEVELLLKGRFGNQFPAARFAPALFKMTGGNPLHLVQMLTPIPVGEEATERLEKIVEERRTDTLSAIEQRIKLLDAPSLTLLKYASVVSERFPVSILKYMLGIDFPLKTALRSLQRYRLASVEVGEKTAFFCFEHAAAREAVRLLMDDAERERISSLAAEALKHHYGLRAEKHLMTIAERYEEAGEKDNAIDMYLKAGDYFLKLAALSSAEEAFRSAIRLSTKRRQRLEAMVKLIGTLDAEYKVDDCLALSEEFFNLSPPLRLKAKVFLVLTHLYIVEGSLERAIEYGKKAIETAERCRSKEESAKASALLAIALSTEGRNEEALMYARRGYELAKRLGHEGILGTTLNACAVVDAIKGNKKDALMLFEQGARAYEKAGYLFQAAQCLGNVGIILRETGDYKKAVRIHMETAEAFEEMGALETAAVTRYYLAVVLMLMGEYRKGLAIIEGELPRFRMLKATRDTGNALVLKASFLFKMGRLNEGLSALRRGWKMLQRQKQWKEKERVMEARVEAALLSNRIDDALQETASFLTEALNHDSEPMRHSALILRLRALLAANHTEEAERIALSIKDEIPFVRNERTLATLKASLALYSAETGDIEGAEELLAEAVATEKLPKENYAEGLFAIGKALFDENNFKEALRYLHRAEDEYSALVKAGYRRTELEEIESLLKRAEKRLQ